MNKASSERAFLGASQAKGWAEGVFDASSPSEAIGEDVELLPMRPRLVRLRAGVWVADRHSTWTIVLHWSSVAALVVATAAILVHMAVEDKALRILLMDIHRQAGLFVLFALFMRLAVRFTKGMTDFAHDMPLVMRLGAKLAHAGLYLSLLVLTVLGWASTNAHGVSLKLFGVLPLPNLVEDDPDVADTLTDYHLWTAWVLLGLVVAHIAAACWHHFKRRDAVLSAMLPWARRERKLRLKVGDGALMPRREESFEARRG